jgi:AraC-like DNA-binding protein
VPNARPSDTPPTDTPPSDTPPTDTPPSDTPPSDTRGIIDPADMERHAVLHRYPAGDLLEGLVDWFWGVTWQLTDGETHVQQVLNHPSGHISIGTLDDAGADPDHPGGRVYGLITRISQRRLTGTGWTVAAKTTTGGLGALLGRPARTITDRVLSLHDALGLDDAPLVAQVVAEPTEEQRVHRLRAALEATAARRDPDLLRQAREVARVARIAETDRGVHRVEQLAAAAGVSVRTLQRQFGQLVGASPAWVIRRWRIIEAAERAAAADPSVDDGQWPGWADLAAELGYSDQAHLARDVRRHLGTTPSGYRARQSGRRPS